MTTAEGITVEGVHFRPVRWSIEADKCGHPLKTRDYGCRRRPTLLDVPEVGGVVAPACHMHQSREERRAQEVLERSLPDLWFVANWKAGARIYPACWEWPIPSTPLADIQEDQVRWYAFVDWHEGRCAACGGRCSEKVLDHDHYTWMVRGLLCKSCNIQEGFSRSDFMFRRYRELPPAGILGYELEYVSPFFNERRRRPTLEEKAVAGNVVAAVLGLPDDEEEI